MASRYPEEMRQEVVALARRREAPISQLAKDFGVSSASIHAWLQKADQQERVAAGTEVDPAELRELKRRNRLLEQENEILRRAAAYFSQASLPK